MDKKEFRKFEIKIGILIFIIGTVIFIYGMINIDKFVSLIEAMSDNEFIQITIIAFFFTIVSLIPLSLYFYIKDRRKSEGL